MAIKHLTVSVLKSLASCGNALAIASREDLSLLALVCFFLWRARGPLTCHRKEKCEVTKIQINCEIMGFVSILRKNKMKRAPLPKISLLVQIGQEI